MYNNPKSMNILAILRDTIMCLMSLCKINYIIMYNNPKSMNILAILRDTIIFYVLLTLLTTGEDLL